MNNFIIRVISGFIFNKKKRKSFRSKYLNKKINFFQYSNGNKIIIVKEDGSEEINPCLGIAGMNIQWGGENSIFRVYEPFNFDNCHIFFGNNNVVEIKPSKYCISNLDISERLSDNSMVSIDENFSSVGIKIFLHDETNNYVKIGKDCMFSFDIVLWPSDGHTIYDTSTQKVLNAPKRGITIGNHCWIGRNVTFLKDSGVSDNSIVGTCSIVTKKYQETNCILAGIPAKMIKKGINWDRKNTQNYEGLI